MRNLFYNCSSLKELNLNIFNINKVTNMYDMLSRCSKELQTKIRSLYHNIKEEAFEDYNIFDSF